MKNISNILWGIVLILVGIVVGLNVLGITNINVFFSGWWTLFIIVPCFIDLFNDKDKTGSIIGILIGIGLFLGCQDVISFDIILKLILPLILIIIGASLIFKDTLKHEVKKKINKLNKNDSSKEYCATFSEQNVNFDKEIFEGADLNAIFGGIKLDLRKSIIKEDAIVNCSSIFGGITLYIPDNINVKVVSTSIFGGVTNKTKKNTDSKYTIYVNAKCLFGGVDLK